MPQRLNLADGVVAELSESSAREVKKSALQVQRKLDLMLIQLADLSGQPHDKKRRPPAAPRARVDRADSAASTAAGSATGQLLQVSPRVGRSLHV